MNRTEALAFIGGAALNNEECYLISELAGPWASSTSTPAQPLTLLHGGLVGAHLGHGAITNHWNDLANSDCLLIIGCNPAENHP